MILSHVQCNKQTTINIVQYDDDSDNDDDNDDDDDVVTMRQSGYPSSTEWLRNVLSVNSRVGAYPNYLTTGILLTSAFTLSLRSFL